MLQTDRRTLTEARQRRHQQPLLAERRPIALGVLDQLVGFRHPERAAAALQPVVEQDAGDLSAFAGPGAVAEKPAAAEADGVFSVVGRGRDDVEGLVHRPRSGEMTAMGLAGRDHAFDLGVGQHAVRDDIGGKVRPIAWLGRRHRRHRHRLHQLGGVSLRAGNTDRLQSVSFIKRLGDVAALDRHPVDGLIGQLNRLRLGPHRRDGGRARRNALRPCGGGTNHRAGDDWRGKREPRRNGIRDPAKQGCGIGGATVQSRKRRRIGRGQTVDHGQARVDGRAMLGIDQSIDGGREHDAPALLQPDEGIGPHRIVGRAVRAGDRNEPASLGKTRERRADMAQGGVGHAAIDIRERGERRVHEHDGRSDAGVEVIMDVRGVKAGDGDTGEQMAQQPGARLGQLIENERPAREFGEDGEQAGAGRRFQHEIGARDRGGGAGREAEGDRRRELLKRLAFLGAARVGGQKGRDLGQHRQYGGGRGCPREHGGAELAQEQDGRRLASIVGGLPVPGAIGVGTAEGGDHGCAEHRCVDTLAAFEMGQDHPCGMNQRVGRNRNERRDRARYGREGGRGSGNHRHEGNLGRAGTGRAEGRSLSTPTAQTRPGCPLPLNGPVLGARSFDQLIDLKWHGSSSTAFERRGRKGDVAWACWQNGH